MYITGTYYQSIFLFLSSSCHINRIKVSGVIFSCPPPPLWKSRERERKRSNENWGGGGLDGWRGGWRGDLSSRDRELKFNFPLMMGFSCGGGGSGMEWKLSSSPSSSSSCRYYCHCALNGAFWLQERRQDGRESTTQGSSFAVKISPFPPRLVVVASSLFLRDYMEKNLTHVFCSLAPLARPR